ncbi:MAG: hypothetical protein R6V13_00845 [Anaerolineae bacterium]
MSLHNCPFSYLLLCLCLAVALVACDNTPTRTPTAVAEDPTPTATSFDETPTPTATSEMEEPAVSVPTSTPTITPTPTGEGPAGDVPSKRRCEGLAGQLEIQVLVGPAEAVGLKPVAVGNVPFSVVGSGSPYTVEGQGPISYEAVLQKEWGSYAVRMDLDMAVQGECSGEEGSEHLDLVLEMTGEQLVVVDAGGFQGEYPWSGTRSLDLTFPLEEGATAEGEGWVVVLHLNNP